MLRFRTRISMHAWVSTTDARSQRRPKCTVAGAGTNRYCAGFYNTETCAKEGKEVACASLRPAEMFMRACRRPTEVACFRVRKCANNHQLIVAGVQRFV